MVWSRKNDSADAHGGAGKPSSSGMSTSVDPGTGIDFAKYELDELGANIRSIVDVPGAIGQALKYVLTIPFVVAIVVWIVFSSRIAAWIFVPFVIGAFVLGGYFVARKRVDLVAGASNERSAGGAP